MTNTEQQPVAHTADEYKQDLSTVLTEIREEAQRRGWGAQFDEFMQRVRGKMTTGDAIQTTESWTQDLNIMVRVNVPDELRNGSTDRYTVTQTFMDWLGVRADELPADESNPHDQPRRYVQALLSLGADVVPTRVVRDAYAQRTATTTVFGDTVTAGR